MFNVENIRKLCRERGITIAELERRTGLGNGVISRWETAPRSPQIDSIILIAQELDVTIDTLVPESKKNPATDGDGKKADSVYDEKHAYINSIFDKLNFENQVRAVNEIQSLLQSQSVRDDLKESD